VSVAAPMTEVKLELLLASGAVAPEGEKEPEVVAKGKVAGEAAEGGEPAKAGVAAPTPDAKGGEKKGAAAPKTEKKEAEKKK
jgi:large subunit ribosomal protein L25